MLLDQENLRPVMVAMAVYIAIVIVTTRLITRPVGIKAVDDLILYVKAQESQMMSGTILTGLIVLATNYVVQELM
jgi:hypothetical protein